jgi:hypothetical protein
MSANRANRVIPTNCKLQEEPRRLESTTRTTTRCLVPRDDTDLVMPH